MASARDEITDLLFAYAERIDSGDFDGLAQLFEDAELTFEGHDQVHRGQAEVRALYEASTRRYPDDGTPKTKHLVTNVIVSVDDSAGTAAARSYFTVLQAVPAVLSLQPIISGRYDDRFGCTNGRWHFTARRITVDLVGDLGSHLLFDLE